MGFYGSKIYLGLVAKSDAQSVLLNSDHFWYEKPHLIKWKLVGTCTNVFIFLNCQRACETLSVPFWSTYGSKI